MHMLKDERLAQHAPTQYPTAEVSVRIGFCLEHNAANFVGEMVKPVRVPHRTPPQELQMAGINFKAFDLGGHEIARKVWKDYYAKVRRC